MLSFQLFCSYGSLQTNTTLFDPFRPFAKPCIYSNGRSIPLVAIISIKISLPLRLLFENLDTKYNIIEYSHLF